jgi:uncharacterized integral membrane protein
MRALIKFLLVTPVAILLLAFAFANRQIVTVSFDPFAPGEASALALAAPLFLVLLLVLMLGIVAGGLAMWLGQSKFRRAARQARIEADRLRSEAGSWRARADQASSTEPVRPA